MLEGLYPIAPFWKAPRFWQKTIN